jgi:acetoin:2,6-dichlorophenolindophenol oxidoreductase subunit alpha
VANNQYAYSPPTDRQFACRNLVDKAIGYGIEGMTVEGTDLEACLVTLHDAVHRARNGHGPQLVVGSLLRLVGHGEHDDAHYVDAALRASSLGQDCLRLAEEAILARRWARASALEEWHQDAVRQVEEAVATTIHEPLPDPNEEDWCALSTRHLSEG